MSVCKGGWGRRVRRERELSWQGRVFDESSARLQLPVFLELRTVDLSFCSRGTHQCDPFLVMPFATVETTTAFINKMV